MSEKVGIEEILSRAFESERIIFAQRKAYRTYAVTGTELHQAIQKLRVLFKQEDIQENDKIILLGYPSIEWIEVYLAAISSGIVVVPLDTVTDHQLLEKIQQQVQAKAVFQDRGLESIEIKHFYLQELGAIVEKTKAQFLLRHKSSPKDVIEIMYTSGTTGEPKGVILTRENIDAGISAAIKANPLKLHLRMLNLLPLSHIFGQIIGIFFFLHYGYETYFFDSIQPRKIIDYIRDKRIHAMITVPGMVQALQTELQGKSVLFRLGPQFRLIGVGGAALDPALEKWWRRKLILVLQGYGLTETSAMVATNSPWAHKTGSVGKIVDGVSVKLSDDAEILVRGKNITPGYYMNEEKTKESFEDGWYKTGDVGEIRDGYLYILDRKKDIIVTAGGLKVYPSDIEAILNANPAVRESCVLEKEKRIHAVIIPKKDADVAKIIADTNKKLLLHQHIAGYTIWPSYEFPKTATGKIQKFKVSPMLAKPTTGRTQTHGSKIHKILHEVLQPQLRIKPHVKLSDLGMDSLKRLELISAIERDFGMEIEETRVDQNTRVTDLEDILEEKKIAVRLRHWTRHAWLRFLLQRVLAFPQIRVWTKTEYRGLDNLKLLNGPVIFVSNHQSAWDAPVIIRKIKQKVAIAADAEYVFGIGTTGARRIYRSLRGFLSELAFNTYPFGESIGTGTSLHFTGQMLDRGYSILIFPEAHRTTDGTIKEFKRGIGYLGVHMHTPIVPIKIEGLFDVLPTGKLWPKPGRTIVTIGKPMMLKETSYIAATKKIEGEVRSL